MVMSTYLVFIKFKCQILPDTPVLPTLDQASQARNFELPPDLKRELFLNQKQSISVFQESSHGTYNKYGTSSLLIVNANEELPNEHK
ncbi:hypothetical protein DsansV1_C06g0065461 [Dioscorea sansibarensis]